jgi:ABC-type nitrate/sulfonate/bicarbonate transport system permease component
MDSESQKPRLSAQTRASGSSFQAHKIVTFGDPTAAQGGFIWSLVSTLFVFLLWVFFSGWLPEGLKRLIPGPPDWIKEGVFWLPTPAEVWTSFIDLVQNGYRNANGINPYPFIVGVYLENIRGLPEAIKVPVLHGHLWDSLFRVGSGFFWGSVLGIPVGISMALSKVARGLFDPIIEFFRPIPPLAWVPLLIAVFGIDDDGKIFLLFMAAFPIMVIAARAGAVGTRLSKVHAAYALGANQWQVLRYVILPNSMPEILTGMRVMVGVCWGTVVAAEMIGGVSGAGFSVNFASKFFKFDVIWPGIILMGLIGILIDLLMRQLIRWLIPWQGKG